MHLGEDALHTDPIVSRAAEHNLDKDGFIKLLTPEGGQPGGGTASFKIVRKADSGANNDPKTKAATEHGTNSASGWKILQDDYMLGAKMTDWNQDESDSDS